MPKYEVIIPMEYTVELEADTPTIAQLQAELEAEQFRLKHRDPITYGPLFYMDRDITVNEL